MPRHGCRRLWGVRLSLTVSEYRGWMLKSTHRFGAAQISSCNKLIAVSVRGEDTAHSLIRFIKALLKKAVNLDAYANEKRAQHDASLKRDVANTSSELTVM